MANGHSPALFGRGLKKTFGETVAVADVSISVAAGEVVSLIGPNGAGKSTLLAILAGLLIPDAGNAQIRGVIASAGGGLARRQLGFLSGDTALYGKLRCDELLTFFGRLHCLEAPELEVRVATVVDELGLGPFLSQRCDTLSSGQAQRVNLARALVHDPAVIILDEPTTALDVGSQHFVLEAIERAKDQGRAVLFSSHVMGEVEQVADRVLLLREGRIEREGTLAQLLAEADGAGLGRFFLDAETAQQRQEHRGDSNSQEGP